MLKYCDKANTRTTKQRKNVTGRQNEEEEEHIGFVFDPLLNLNHKPDLD